MTQEDKEIYPTPQIIKISDQKEITFDTWKKLSGKLKLLTDPLLYAQQAIICLEEQLSLLKSHKKKVRISSRIEMWKKAIEMMEVKNGQNQESKSREIVSKETNGE